MWKIGGAHLSWHHVISCSASLGGTWPAPSFVRLGNKLNRNPKQLFMFDSIDKWHEWHLLWSTRTCQPPGNIILNFLNCSTLENDGKCNRWQVGMRSRANRPHWTVRLHFLLPKPDETALDSRSKSEDSVMNETSKELVDFEWRNSRAQCKRQKVLYIYNIYIYHCACRSAQTRAGLLVHVLETVPRIKCKQLSL